MRNFFFKCLSTCVECWHEGIGVKEMSVQECFMVCTHKCMSKSAFQDKNVKAMLRTIAHNKNSLLLIRTGLYQY